MPAPTLALAQEACEFARSCCELKSDNKMNPGMSKEKEGRPSVNRLERRREAYKAITQLRKEYPTRNGDLDLLHARAQAAADVGAGNCFELSAIAFMRLASKDVLPLEMVSVKDPGDHVFVVMGLARPLGEVARDMTTWGRGVFVCDPWANIYTRAYLYDNWWRVQMTKWAGNNKQVAYNGKFDKPTSEVWFTSINQGKKFVDYCLDD